MYLRAVLTCVIMLIPVVAIAEPTEKADDLNKLEYIQYKSTDGGFSLDLPKSGVIADPKSDAWEAEENIAVEWYAEDDEPILLIQVSVKNIAKKPYDKFLDDFLDTWRGSSQYEILKSKVSVRAGEQVWQLIEIADHSDSETSIYYSLFNEYCDNKVYTISFYYLEQINQDIRDYGAPVLESFELIEK